jgi:MYND finger
MFRTYRQAKWQIQKSGGGSSSSIRRASASDELERRRGLGLSVYCDCCGANNSNSLMICSRCRSTFFCNRDCQRQGWKAHKPVCWQHGKSQWTLRADGLRTTPQGETFLTLFPSRTMAAGELQVTGQSLISLGWLSPAAQSPTSATTAVFVVDEMDQNKRKTKRTLTVRNDIVACLCGIESLMALQAQDRLSFIVG